MRRLPAEGNEKKRRERGRICSRAGAEASGGLCRLSEALTLRERRENGGGLAERRERVQADALPRFCGAGMSAGGASQPKKPRARA